MKYEPIPKFPVGPVLRELGLSGHLRGHGRTKVRCPFHADSTPSATVDEDAGWFHCFTCGIHADAIDLLQREGLSFADARAEAERIGGSPAPVRQVTGRSMLEWF